MHLGAFFFAIDGSATADATFTLPTPQADRVGMQITVVVEDASGTYDTYVDAVSTNNIKTGGAYSTSPLLVADDSTVIATCLYSTTQSAYFWNIQVLSN